MNISDEIFMEQLLERKLIDRVLGKAALFSSNKKRREGQGVPIWDILQSQQLISSEQSMEIRKDWEQKFFPIIGDYRITRVIGEGKTGGVFEAFQITANRMVALKILSEVASLDFEFLKRFRQEANIGKSLNHRNILQIYEVSSCFEKQLLSMEYLSGKNLREIMKDSGGKISANLALEIGKQVCQALIYSSSKQIVHQDIRPENIFIVEGGIVKIGGFGLIEQWESHEGLLGNPSYMSIEQAQGRGKSSLDVRADIYSLGISLYEMISGQLPYQGSPSEILSQHLNSEAPKLSSMAIPLLGGVEEMIFKMIAKAPENRYANPDLILHDIQSILSGGTLKSEAPKTTSIVLDPNSSYYIFQKAVHFGALPSGKTAIPNIFEYFLRVNGKLGSILEKTIQSVSLFSNLTRKNKEILEQLQKNQEENKNLIFEILDNYRQLYSLSLHPVVQGLVGKTLLDSLQAKVNTYITHLAVYFKNLGIDPSRCTVKTIQIEEALPVLESMGLVAVAVKNEEPDETDITLGELDLLLAEEKTNHPANPSAIPSVSPVEKTKLADPLDFLGIEPASSPAEETKLADPLDFLNRPSNAPASPVEQAGVSDPLDFLGPDTENPPAPQGGLADPLDFLGPDTENPPAPSPPPAPPLDFLNLNSKKPISPPVPSLPGYTPPSSTSKDPSLTGFLSQVEERRGINSATTVPDSPIPSPGSVSPNSTPSPSSVSPNSPESKSEDPSFSGFLNQDDERRGVNITAPPKALGVSSTSNSPNSTAEKKDEEGVDLEASLQSLLGEEKGSSVSPAEYLPPSQKILPASPAQQSLSQALFEESQAPPVPEVPVPEVPVPEVPVPEVPVSEAQEEEGNWLLGDDGGGGKEEVIDQNWLLGEDVDVNAEGEEGGWLLGGEGGEFSFGEEGDSETVVSLWGNPDGEEIKKTLSLVVYDPKSSPGGSSFIDVRYDLWYRNESPAHGKEPIVEVRVKKSQMEKFHEIYVRVKSFRGMDKSGDGTFVIVVHKQKSTKRLVTWFDSSTRKKIVYVINPKSLKGADPEKMIEMNPFETPNRDVNRIIKVAFKNYSLTK